MHTGETCFPHSTFKTMQHSLLLNLLSKANLSIFPEALVQCKNVTILTRNQLIQWWYISSVNRKKKKKKRYKIDSIGKVNLPIRATKIWLAPGPHLMFSKQEEESYLMCAESLQSCPTLCDPMNCSPSGSSVHGILHARILEWVAMPSSRVSSWPRDWNHISYVSRVGKQVLYH